MVQIFISYRRSDASAWAGRIAAELRYRFGDRGLGVYHDVGSVEPGRDYKAAIATEVGRCAALLAVIGPDWVGRSVDGRRRIDQPDDQVRRELRLAGEAGLLVAPVLVDGADLAGVLPLPPDLSWLADRQMVEIRRDEAERDLASVLHRLGTSLGLEPGRVAQPKPPDAGIYIETYNSDVTNFHL